MNKQGSGLFSKFKETGSQSDFNELFGFYFDKLVRFAHIITRSDELAEEAVIDVFVRIWNRRSERESPSNVDIYLFVAVRNSALNKVRGEKKYSFDIFGYADVTLADHSPGVVSELITEDMFDALGKAVDKLPPKCKMVFQLMREQGLDRRQAAKVLDVSVKTIDNQLVIAIRKIAAELKIDTTYGSSRAKVLLFLFL